ncbi:hypothetical protein ACOME3_005490 [Neoechinorhynchus agilis]
MFSDNKLVSCNVQLLKGHIYDGTIVIRSTNKKSDEYRIVRPINQLSTYSWGWPLQQLGTLNQMYPSYYNTPYSGYQYGYNYNYYQNPGYPYYGYSPAPYYYGNNDGCSIS